eukprot:gene53012-23788_t
MYQMSSGSRKMTGKLERATQADPMSSNERNNGNDGNNGSELVGARPQPFVVSLLPTPAPRCFLSITRAAPIGPTLTLTQPAAAASTSAADATARPLTQRE